MLKGLGEVEAVDDGVRIVPDPYNLSLFPFRHYTPYAHNNPSVEGLRNSFFAQRHRNPFLYDDDPYGPYKGLYFQPLLHQDGYNEEDSFRYDFYSHPAVKPVAIVPGDEYAMYYPASYPILSTVPVVAAPPAPSVAPIAPISPIDQQPPLPAEVQL
jgi:hypothetical protein